VGGGPLGLNAFAWLRAADECVRRHPGRCENVQRKWLLASDMPRVQTSRHGSVHCAFDDSAADGAESRRAKVKRVA
jgi:hypothetical protein